MTYLTVKAGDWSIEVKAARDYRAELDSEARIGFNAERIYLFDTASGQRLC